MIPILSTLNSTIPPAPTLLKRDAILIFGQSNIDGRDALLDFPTDISNPSTNVKIINGVWEFMDFTKIPYGDDVRDTWAADAVMTNRLTTSLNQDVYVIKKSKGGTCFFNPNPSGKGTWNANVNGSLLDVLISRYATAKNYSLQVENRDLEIKFIWCDIGETDSTLSDIITFKNDFKDSINKIRNNIISQPNVPIIWRELGLNQAGVYQWIIDAQNELVNELSNLILIPNTGFTMFDSVHLDASSSINYADQVQVYAEQFYNE